VKSAKELIGAMFDADLAAAGRSHSAFRIWNEIVGENIASHSKVKDVHNGTLVIEVDHPGWSQMVRLAEPRILATIQKRYPELGVRTFRIVAGDEENGLVDLHANPPAELAKEIDLLRDTDTPEHREFANLLERLKKLGGAS